MDATTITTTASEKDLLEALAHGSFNERVVAAGHPNATEVVLMKAVRDRNVEPGQAAANSNATEASVGHVVMTGETPLSERASLVERFQTDPDARGFIGSMAVAAEGITLTAASHVIFAELDWTPGRVAQAEDRAHRIGQHDSVLVEHVVVDGSIDARIAQVLLEKAQVAATVLGDTPATETPEPDVLAAGLEFGDEDEELEMLLATDDALVA